MSDITGMNIVQHKETILAICASASSELALEQCLNKIVKAWKKRDFKFAKLFIQLPKITEKSFKVSLFILYLLDTKKHTAFEKGIPL